MGVFDFLFGKPGQSGQLDPETKRARDFLLNQMLMQYSAGPVNVPQYMAVAPQAQYSGTNALLSSLGLEGVAPPSMPTTTVGGMEVYTSQPFQEQMETSYAERYPGQYDYLRSFYMDPVTGEFGERSYGYNDPMATQPVAPIIGGSGGDDDDPLERHYSIFPETRPKTGPYASKVSSKLDTKGQIGKYSGSMGGQSVFDKIKSDFSYAGSKIKKDLGGLFGKG
jgi:hypothetical protein